MTTKLFESGTIDRIAQESTDAVDYLINLYKYAVDLENVKHVNGYPRISINTVHYIFACCPSKGKEDFAMLWLNKGFSADNETDDFVLDLSNVTLE